MWNQHCRMGFLKSICKADEPADGLALFLCTPVDKSLTCPSLGFFVYRNHHLRWSLRRSDNLSAEKCNVNSQGVNLFSDAESRVCYEKLNFDSGRIPMTLSIWPRDLTKKCKRELSIVCISYLA